jgi:hypothetical protein
VQKYQTWAKITQVVCCVANWSLGKDTIEVSRSGKNEARRNYLVMIEYVDEAAPEYEFICADCIKKLETGELAGYQGKRIVQLIVLTTSLERCDYCQS